MKIQIQIDDRLVSAIKLTLGGKRGAWIAATFVLALTGAVWALTDTGDFVDGTPISAKAVNDRFKLLFDGVNSLQTQVAATPGGASVFAKYWMSEASASAAQSLPASAAAVVDFNVKETDANSISSVATVQAGSGWKFTAPVAGTYAVAAFLRINGPVSGDGRLDFYVQKNGQGATAQKIGGWTNPVSPGASGGSHFVLNGATAIVLETGDYINFIVGNQSANPVALEGDGNVTIWLNANSPQLDPATIKPVYEHGGKKYSINAGFCGKTAAMDGAGVGGFDGAKAKCEIACNSVSAHMCTGEEMLRTQATDPTFANANTQNSWIFATMSDTDCNLWTSANSALSGPEWVGRVTTQKCNLLRPIGCCD